MQETVTSFNDAESKCMIWGSRLFQPRSTQGLNYFSSAEVDYMQGELFKFIPTATSFSLIAIGLFYQQLANDGQAYLYYR